MTTHPGIEIPLADLKPTQMTVGLREVAVKRKQWRDADAEGRAKILRRHIIPAVVGPKGKRYIVDHHHLARALLEEGVQTVPVMGLANLEALSKDEFWTFMDNSAWCHAYDARGRRRPLSEIPKTLADLADDPFRSLVGELIRSGGCAKSSKPFSEFMWADFLRRRIDHDLIDKHFAKAMTRAKTLAKSPEAKSLPGWCGPDPIG